MCVPAGTPAIVKRPAALVSAPSGVPTTATCALWIGWLVAESTTRPVMTAAITGALTPSSAAGVGAGAGGGLSAGTSAMRPLFDTHTSTPLSPSSRPSACSTDSPSTSTETIRSAGMNARL